MKLILFCSLMIIILYVPSAFSKVQSATLSVDIPAGQNKTLRLKNLPKDAAVKVEVEGNGNFAASLLNESNFEKYPEVLRPLFQSNVRDKISFTVRIPEYGDYYVVFDNTSTLREINLNVTIHGASGSDAVQWQKDSKPETQEETVKKTLGSIGHELNKLFIFTPFAITAEKCGKEGAFSGPDGIVLCKEFAQKILTTVGSNEKSVNVLLFTIFHEAGHILLSQWGYPFYDNEDICRHVRPRWTLFVIL
jgi:hypothetical protein